MFVYQEPTDEPVYNTDRNPESKGKPYVTGDRISTFMIFLSKVIMKLQTDRIFSIA